MTLLRALLALALAHTTGATLRAIPSLAGGESARRAIASHLRSPASALVAVAILHGASLGLAGAPIVLALVATILWPLRSGVREEELGLSRVAATLGAVAAACIVARPMVPTCWDEFVWLGKARFESEGFGAGVQAALDPSSHLVPPGYPTLWPAAAGWLALGADDLEAITAGASMLVVLAVAVFIERVARTTPRGLEVLLAGALALGAPLVLVHARTTYVDLPLGLLSASLFLELAGPSPSSSVAAALAIALVGIKDEGVAHLGAAALAAAYARGDRLRALPAAFLSSAAAGALTLAAWQALLSAHHVGRDHGGLSPALAWATGLPLLLARHATELTSWGLFWPAFVVAAALERKTRRVRAAALALTLNLACVAAMLALGPPRVRAFAENGTLVNRVLVQLWPLATVALLAAAAHRREADASATT